MNNAEGALKVKMETNEYLLLALEAIMNNAEGALKVKMETNEYLLPQKKFYIKHDGKDVLIGTIMPEAIMDLQTFGYELPEEVVKLSAIPLTPYIKLESVQIMSGEEFDKFMESKRA